MAASSARLDGSSSSPLESSVCVPGKAEVVHTVFTDAAPKPYVTILEEPNDRSLLQCEVHGDPEPEVEWRDSAGNTLPAEKTQDERIGNLFYITLRTTVTQTGLYRCVATQKTISHQVSNEISVYFSEPKVIKVEEGCDVTLPCRLWPVVDLTLKGFTWKKRPEAGGRQKDVFLYDKGVLNNGQSEEVKGQDEQFRGRVEYFPEELKQGNASIIIKNTLKADSGDYFCYHLDPQKPQMFEIHLVVVASLRRHRSAPDECPLMMT
ncbi:uncharacterized protein LOC116685471 [Etheostoma spectabile]|uniref:uncharacterized protein LOC116685471 n=1 Tax=Etheostoma spectabile TaxID=54343 RepID=UPI0013AF7A11|nr:uncharacterized protein LOC116685471 [Etheostoma spectabile]